jgi:response regulator RpfG family c-di-GMP phosphodiesterase
VTAIRYSHEHFDGSGYPEGLVGKAIPLAARIVAAADLLEHLASYGGEGGRPVPLEVAVDLLVGKAGRELDPEVVNAFIGAARAGLLKPVETFFGEGAALNTSLFPPAGADAQADMTPERGGGAAGQGIR